MNEQRPQRNTKICLMYRDADNYKQSIDEVVSGSITDEQIQKISPKLADGTFIIAEVVGLPTPSFKFRNGDFPSEDSDHVFTTWTDFEDGKPTSTSMLTDEAPTLDLDIDTLVARVLAADWEASLPAEWERMASGGGVDGPSVKRLRTSH